MIKIRFYVIMSAEKHVVVPDTRQPQPHKQGCISKRISKKFLEIFLEIDIPYGVRDFSRFEQKRAENPCKHWGFNFFYRLLSSRKIRQIPMGDCALKTVCRQARGFESHTIRHILHKKKFLILVTTTKNQGLFLFLCALKSAFGSSKISLSTGWKALRYKTFYFSHGFSNVVFSGTNHL